MAMHPNRMVIMIFRSVISISMSCFLLVGWLVGWLVHHHDEPMVKGCAPPSLKS